MQKLMQGVVHTFYNDLMYRKIIESPRQLVMAVGDRLTVGVDKSLVLNSKDRVDGS